MFSECSELEIVYNCIICYREVLCLLALGRSVGDPQQRAFGQRENWGWICEQREQIWIWARDGKLGFELQQVQISLESSAMVLPVCSAEMPTMIHSQEVLAVPGTVFYPCMLDLRVITNLSKLSWKCSYYLVSSWNFLEQYKPWDALALGHP